MNEMVEGDIKVIARIAWGLIISFFQMLIAIARAIIRPGKR